MRAAIGLLPVVAMLMGHTAWAGPRDFVVAMPAFLGTSEQAAPVLATVCRHLEKSLGWPPLAIAGSYHPEPDDALEAIRSLQPGFAVVTLQMYAEHQRDLKMRVIGGMRLSNGALGRFHVVVRTQGGPASLEELAGKTIASPHLAEARFAERVLFGGKLPLAAVKVVHVTAPLAALRAVDRGQADAAVVDEAVVRQLKSLPYGAGLRVIHSTEELPPLPVVALGTATASDQAAVQKALPGLCSGEQGASLCHLFRTETFVPATEETFAAIVRELR